MIVKCSCTHDYQDRKYGKNMRVANPTAKGNAQTGSYRCTVCTNIITKGLVAKK